MTESQPAQNKAKTALLVVLGVVALVALAVEADRNWLAGVKPPAAGSVAASPAPNVTFTDLQGNEVSLEQLRGKVVVVNFWATWCQPCRIEIPWMIEFQEKYGERGFVVLGVAMDEEGKSVVEPYVQQERFEVNGEQKAINYSIVLGNEQIAEKFGGLLGIPTSVIISRDGRITRRFIGLVDHELLVKEIEGLL